MVRKQNTPLHLAATKWHTEVVKALLNAGAEPSVKDMFGLTVLKLAENYHHEATAKVVADHKLEEV